MSVVDRLMEGSIDTHLHLGPDPRRERRLSAVDGMLDAEEAGMRAIVLKCHDYPTAPIAGLAGHVVDSLLVFGSLALNTAVGGLNPDAVDASARMGAKIIWMPTFSAAGNKGGPHYNKKGISILDDKSELKPQVVEILSIIKSNNITLASGHISVEETYALVEKARSMGLSKVVITHPLTASVGAHLNIAQQKEMVEKGALIEHCFVSCMPSMERLDPAEIAKAVKAVGPENCVLSTDFGQAQNPPPAEGMRMAISAMLGCGLDEEDVELLVKTNPARLLNLA